MKAALAVRVAAAAAVGGIMLSAQDDFAAHLRTAEQLYGQGAYSRAEKILLRLSKEAQSFGPDDVRTALVLNNLGAVCHGLERYSEAERHYQRAIVILKRVPGPHDILLAKFKGNLAGLYCDTGQWAKAERLELGPLATRLQSLKPDHPDVLRLLVTVAAVDQAHRRYAESELRYRQALASWEKIAPQSIETMQTINNLGTLYRETGRNAEALACFERALAIAEQTPGSADPLFQIKSLVNVGTLRLILQGPAEAEMWYKRALAIAEPTLGPEHPLVGRILLHYAVVLQLTKRKADAKKCQRRAEAILQAAFREGPTRHTVDFSDLLKSSKRK